MALTLGTSLALLKNLFSLYSGRFFGRHDNGCS